MPTLKSGSPQLEISYERDGEKLTIYFNGKIDEECDLTLVELPSAKVIHLNFSKVTWINSIGVKKWISWQNQIGENRILVFEECRRVVVDQINVLAGFLMQSARVESFYIPFHCGKCDIESVILVKRGTDYTLATSESKAQLTLPEPDCSNCKEKLQLDVLPEKYLGFLKRVTNKAS